MGNALIIEHRKLSQLSGLDQSLRVHSKRQHSKLMISLATFGQVVPILIDHDNRVIDGALVAMAMAASGWDEVAVVVVNNRSPEELRLLRIALNRLPQDAGWNNERLANELRELLELGFDLELTGFDAVEIDMALAIEDCSENVVDDLPPEPIAGPTVAQPGEVWVMDNHRVLCGDAREPENLRRLMGASRAAMMFSDPPYNVAIDGFVAGRGRHREFAMASGEMSRPQFVTFLADFLQAATPHLADGAILDICMDWRHSGELLEAISLARLTLMNCCVWAKTNAGMGTFYRSQHELVWIAKHGTAPHQNNFELGQQGRSRSNLWTYRGMNAPGRERDQLIKLHPTVKPVALVIDAIKDVTRRADIVLDPFMGSGTTLIAAQRTGRCAYGIELDPAYVDVIIRRWEAETGHLAVRADNCATFAEAEFDALEAAPPPLALSAPHSDEASRD